MALARRWTRRLLRASLYALVAILLLSATLRTATYLYRLRAEHLMADLQSLQLRHSTWPEAQRLITRWGRYGHYEGTCDASFCRYTISLQSPQFAVERAYFTHRRSDVGLSTTELLFTICEHLGGRSALLKGTFVVQDGIVLRKGMAMNLSVVIDDLPEIHSYVLLATSHAASPVVVDGFVEGDIDQLADHPFYVAARPSGCEGCMAANVTFSPDTPESQVRKLTTFNLSCLTRLRSCRYIEDVFPASEDWHFYDGTTGARPITRATPLRNPKRPLACDISVSARGREATQIFSVTSLSESQQIQSGFADESATVRLDAILKGDTRHRVGEIVPASGRTDDAISPLGVEVPLEPGKHFLMLSFKPEYPTWPISLNRCSVIPDTPENRAQLQQGISQNDILRHPDPRTSWYEPD